MTTDNRTNEPTEAQVEAAAREWYEQANGYETWASASGKHQQVVKVRAAKALVAAARVPVQGEPNDGATQDRIAEIACTALGHRQGGDECMTDYAIADAILAEFTVISRATVPDAATEELARIKPLFENYSREYPNECNKRVKAEAERDAALAAITRVTAERDSAMARIAKAWELHEPFTWSFGYGPVQSCKWCADHGAPQEVASWPCPTIAALEGAPEPEALEIPETGLEVRDGDGDLITTGEHRRVLHQGGYVCDTCVNILGINVRWDRADRMEGHPLPAEGERK